MSLNRESEIQGKSEDQTLNRRRFHRKVLASSAAFLALIQGTCAPNHRLQLPDENQLDTKDLRSDTEKVNQFKSKIRNGTLGLQGIQESSVRETPDGRIVFCIPHVATGLRSSIATFSWFIVSMQSESGIWTVGVPQRIKELSTRESSESEAQK
jgi:hypothetical protein